ncbi:hypothetical protein ACV229_07975 [Burkholderia sp. MR1-5-21]
MRDASVPVPSRAHPQEHANTADAAPDQAAGMHGISISLNQTIQGAAVRRDTPGRPPDGWSFLQRIEQRQSFQEDTMKVRGTNGSLRVWGALLTGLCAGAVAVAALGSPAAFAGGKPRHVGHGSLPVKGSIAARFPTLLTGPHPSEAKNAGKFKPQQL